MKNFQKEKTRQIISKQERFFEGQRVFECRNVGLEEMQIIKFIQALESEVYSEGKVLLYTGREQLWINMEQYKINKKSKNGGSYSAVASRYKCLESAECYS